MEVVRVTFSKSIQIVGAIAPEPQALFLFTAYLLNRRQPLFTVIGDDRLIHCCVQEKK